MEPVDLIVFSRWIIPVVPARKTFHDCALIIQEERIHDIVPADEARRKYQAAESLDLSDHVLLPGLVNSHGHGAMSLLRGFADDKPLKSWLEDHIWPAEGQWVSEEFVRDGTELAIAEIIRSGTTCFSDMYFFPDQASEVAVEMGIRAQIAFPVLEFPSAWARNAEEYIHKGLAICDAYKNHSRIHPAFGPHATYTVSGDNLARIAMLVEELDVCTQIHLHETVDEVESFKQQHGISPLQQLVDSGLLSPTTQCVHMTHLTVEDIAQVAEYGASVIHCPASNMKLASGVAPINALLKQNVNVALGTDGAASNNSLNLFSEMRLASLLSKVESGAAESLDAWSVLEMGTINGARAMGLEQITGSLEKGKSADFIAVDLSEVEQQPVYDPISQLVYTDAARQVTHVWCQGNPLMTDRELQTISLTEVREKAAIWRNRIAQA
ncbi:MAG: TRZ/ATZ family hydrolase [bacterium]